MKLVVPRGSEGGGVRLLTILATATALAVVLLAGVGASDARAQSAGLDEYRFPAGTQVQAPGAAGAQGPTSSGGAETMNLPGGYPLTPPVVVLTGVLVAGILLRLAVGVEQRRRSARSTSVPAR